jgi:hypothetical protein
VAGVLVASIDLKRVYKESYSARVGKPSLVEIAPRPFLMIDGAGDPNTAPEYASAVAALYPIAYAIRASIKAATGDAYTVLPLEGLWWADDMEQFSIDRKGDWKWTMMIGLPEAVDRLAAAEAISETTLKKQLAGGVRFEVFDEGLSAQVMHIGPYSEEAPTIELLHEFIAGEGYERRGHHHEIYLGDPRKSDPAKLKTIIRQPVS